MNSDARKWTRRAVLGGAVASAAVGAGLVAGTPALARPGPARAAGYPPLEWVPAVDGNFQVADRPTSGPIDLIVIHVTQETYADTIAIFQNPAKQVSSHYLVRSNDGHVAQLVQEKDIAYHARSANGHSIGIEHEGWVDDPKWFTDAMYGASAQLVAAICDKYAIPKDRQHIMGHNEVPGNDHTDPGPHWDWVKFMDLVAKAPA